MAVLARCRCGEMDFARTADPGRRRPQRAFLPDDRPRAPPGRATRALSGDGAARRNPRLPAARVVAESRSGDGGVLDGETGSMIRNHHAESHTLRAPLFQVDAFT